MLVNQSAICLTKNNSYIILLQIIFEINSHNYAACISLNLALNFVTAVFVN